MKADTRLPSIITAATPWRIITFVGAVLIALFVLPAVLSTFWMKIMFEMAAYSLVTLGLGLLVGRTGMFSLCQIPMVAAGAWFALRIHFLFDGAPFPVIILASAVLTGLLGVIIGLPALRLSGLYLALVTLMAAGAITLLLTVVKFPNSNKGFWGFDKRSPSGQNVLPRPTIAEGDIAFYRYTVVVVAIVFLVAAWHIKGKPGRAWGAIRQSELTATAAGVNNTLYKLWAFALSAAVTGIAGAILVAGAGRHHQPVPGRAVDPAARRGAARRCLQPLGRTRGCVLHARAARDPRRRARPRPRGADDAVRSRRDAGAAGPAEGRRRRPAEARPVHRAQGRARRQSEQSRSRRGRGDARDGGVIDIQNLTVRFGGVVPIDDMTAGMNVGVNGLIGPNGAGKTTFFNVLSGFVRPVDGTVTAFGENLLSMPAFRRVRWGLRRTFQTEQAVAEMSVFENVLLVLEQSGATKSSRRNDVVEAADFVGLGHVLSQPVGTLGAAERRLVEVARAVVGKPRLVLLDEPGAGLPDEETAALGEVIKQIPDRTGALTILVDHDMELVGATCSHVVVLDFGHVIAQGPTTEVLSDPNVMAAYIGTEEVEV